MLDGDIPNSEKGVRGPQVTVCRLADGEPVAVSRGQPVVAVIGCGRPQGIDVTLSGVLRHTPPETTVLLVGVAEDEVEGLRRAIDGQESATAGVLPGIVCLVRPAEDSFARALAAAATAAGPGDLALLAAGVQVGPQWLERLMAAAHCDSTVVSATALGGGVGALSVEGGGGGGGGVERVARAVAARSPRVRPRIVQGGAHCVYLRRELLDRVPVDRIDLDVGSADAATVIAELSRRATALGMVHVAADDVYVTCSAPGRLTPAPEPSTSAPGLSTPPPKPLTPVPEPSTSAMHTPPLRRALACARLALDDLSVTIDARALGPTTGGTQHYTIELVTALAGAQGLKVRVVVPPDISPGAAARIEQIPGLEVLTYEQAVAGVAPSAVVHRPQQIFTVDDLRLLQLLGERVVVGQQDLIAYRNPSYHASPQDWHTYRRVTRLALTAADRVVCFSEHTRADVIAEELIGADRCDVAGIGADVLSLADIPSDVAMAPSPSLSPFPSLSPSPSPSPTPTPIPGVPAERELLVCLGADYAHKNRPFAIELLEALRRRHGWEGMLVLAGAHVPHGSSREEEAGLLAAHPQLAGAVLDVGSIDEQQKAWLYERSNAVVYPSLYEGFGLIPFEAARARRPCLFAPQASLVELAGSEAATLVPWDADLSADAVIGLLVAGQARHRHVQLLRDAAARSRWSEVVRRLRKIYELAIASPWRAAAPRVWEDLERENFIVELHDDAEEFKRAYLTLSQKVGMGLPLIATDGGLLSHDEQRGLMRLAARRLTRGLLLGPVGLLGRLGGDAAALPDDAEAHWKS
jgi:glycosyltransferase involved in cell wall biosynthesis